MPASLCFSDWLGKKSEKSRIIPTICSEHFIRVWIFNISFVEWPAECWTVVGKQCWVGTNVTKCPLFNQDQYVASAHAVNNKLFMLLTGRNPQVIFTDPQDDSYLNEKMTLVVPLVPWLHPLHIMTYMCTAWACHSCKKLHVLVTGASYDLWPQARLVTTSSGDNEDIKSVSSSSSNT